MSPFEIRRVSSGLKFDLMAANGQRVLTSEVYDTEAACLRGIASVKKNVPLARVEDRTEESFFPQPNPKFELYQDKAGQFRFRLKARNGQIIGISDGYKTKTSCLGGIDSVKENALEE